MNATVEVVSASAGTGKTFDLSKRMAAALLDGGDPPVRPEGVMAITYTRRAAAELQSRLRRRLMKEGAWEPAARIRDGYIGTVHAICHRLLREFALEGGLSPALEPMEEVAGRQLLREALDEVLTADDRDLDEVAVRLHAGDWRAIVGDIVAKARENGLSAEALHDCALASLDALFALLPDPRGEVEARDREIVEALEALAPVLEEQAPESKAATGRAEKVAKALASARRHGGAIPWIDLVRVGSALTKGLAAAGPGLRLSEAVEAHTSHPRLHRELGDLVEGVFGVAARVMGVFQERKAAAGQIDYADMLAEAARLLREPRVEAALRERLDLLLVDEFQDTSPLQLAIITRMADLAGRAVWVGDRKQAIYGFQGSDPDLMSAAMDDALAGNDPTVLSRSWRSRPPLVDLVSEGFARALAPHGFPEEQVRLTAAVDDLPEVADDHVAEAWVCGADKVTGPDGEATKPHRWQAVAEGVEALLAEGGAVRVRGADGFEATPLRPRHVAVLVRTHAHGQGVADALHARGIPVSVALTGLTTTAEGVLARAGLALLADPSDGVAAVEVAWLTGGAGADPDAWLDRRLAEVAAWRAECEAREAAGEPRSRAPLAFADDPTVARLRDLAGEARSLAPSEAFDAVLDALDARDLCRRWPESERRLANVEALRSVARSYEDLCRVRRRAATIPGLVAHLAELAGSGDEEDRQARPTDPDAVQVVTWHASKGLEWPVVVMTGLDHKPRDNTFGLHVEPAADGFDAGDPLAGRWLRWWPYPYGRQEKGVALRAAAGDTAAGRRVRDRERRERARLLYVGFTRARDRVVLFADSTKRGVRTHWLDELRDGAGAAALDVPWDEEDGVRTLRVGEATFPCRLRRLSGAPPAERRGDGEVVRWLRETPGPERPPERITPSSVVLADDVAAVVELGEAVRLGDRPPLKAAEGEMEAVGRAVHGFFAADPGDRADRETRCDLAARFLAHFEVSHALEPWRVVDAATNLRRHLEERFGVGRWWPEWPIRWRLDGPDGSRLVVGEVDLVLETNDGLIVVDHKTFPGDAATRDRRALAYAGQLATYHAALERATGRPVLASLLHFPVRGEIQEVRVPHGAFEASAAAPTIP
ncbi:MAG: UvrD-helicase domain-containing protein [Myxococcota bacterium]